MSSMMALFVHAFLSTPSARRATDGVRVGGFLARFLSTPSARRATSSPCPVRLRHPDFYPRPPRGGRLWSTASASPFINFYPRPPRGGRRIRGFRCGMQGYFYPRPPRGGRLASSTASPYSVRFLSTPSARRATWHSWISFALEIDFYPRPPRGGRLRTSRNWKPAPEFLSTPSARRATRTVCGRKQERPISIHALREEGDACRLPQCRPSLRFLSTPSARRATEWALRCNIRRSISIHALREEGDHGRGSRLYEFMISIHALREEGDVSVSLLFAVVPNFYPRPPRGGRR